MFKCNLLLFVIRYTKYTKINISILNFNRDFQLSINFTGVFFFFFNFKKLYFYILQQSERYKKVIFNDFRGHIIINVISIFNKLNYYISSVNNL